MVGGMVGRRVRSEVEMEMRWLGDGGTKSAR